MLQGVPHERSELIDHAARMHTASGSATDRRIQTVERGCGGASPLRRSHSSASLRFSSSPASHGPSAKNGMLPHGRREQTIEHPCVRRAHAVEGGAIFSRKRNVCGRTSVDEFFLLGQRRAIAWALPRNSQTKISGSEVGRSIPGVDSRSVSLGI